MAAACGRRIVDMVWEDLTPAKLLTPHHFQNAITVAMAMGCSTNAIIHLVAMSRRAGAACTVGLDDFDAASRKTPVIANIRPSGDTYLMEDFYYAGGMPALIKTLSVLLHFDAMSVNGQSLGENVATAQVHNADVIRSLDRPLYAEGALAVLKGNIAPAGAVIKPSACLPHLLQHTGRALVFDDYPALKAAVDNPDLDVTADDILVLKNIGPKGAPGMPEAGYMPIPLKLARAGVKDMVRISDGRMSGTAFGTIVLHVTPEAAAGGPLALVRTGDRIRLSVKERRVDLLVDEAELARRRAALPASPPLAERGYAKLYQDHVLQADGGCDFDFLRGPAQP
jgi:dihydroxy-acid dehydratase